MNTPQHNEYPLPNDNYVAFDAISLRNHIIKRLDQEGIYTDHNYIGSNLSSIIDIVSYAFNTLIYYLHKTSNESMFSEAQLYENINRIVKMLDYKPVGYQTSCLSFTASAANFSAGFYTIPRYTRLVIGSNVFSFVEDVSFSVKSTQLSEVLNSNLLYQGRFQENAIYTATGDTGETILINTQSALIDHTNVHVYVFEVEKQKWFEYRELPNMHGEIGSSRCFEKRLNASLQYEVSFGNNINGRKLDQNDLVAIYYLQSSGQRGVLGPQQLQNNSPALSIFSTTTFNQIQRDINTENFVFIADRDSARFSFSNDVGSTIPRPHETPEEIRKNAPGVFKSQYRLVTRADYENYVKTNFAGFVTDVLVFDNWEYCNQYMKYFNDIQVGPLGYKQIVLNQLQYSDSCNFNNVYICAIPRVSVGSSFKYVLPAQKELILTHIQQVKTIGAEVTFADPIYKAAALGVDNTSLTPETANYCQLEIVRDPNSRRSLQAMKQEAVDIFNSFFDFSGVKLGAALQHSVLSKNLLSMNGVKEIRTKNTNTGQTYIGLSLLLWNPVYSNLDIQLVTNDKNLRPFELFYYDNLEAIESKIVVLQS